jgi:hypothetical protein
VLESLHRKIDGGEATVEPVRRKRKVLVHALHYASERGELGSRPLDRIRWRVPKPSVAVDMYYAGLRPEEAIAVALPDCSLPNRRGGG